MSRPAAALPTTPLRARPARAFESVATRIRAELASGSYAVGARLPSERALSHDYGVSRNTLREALRALEHAGLIRLQKGATGGAFVTGSSHDAIASGLMDLFQFGAVSPNELVDARIWLEAIVVREACARITRDGLAELESNVAAAAVATDAARRAEIHMDFHRILARMTGNPIIGALMNGLLDIKVRYVERLGPFETHDVLASRHRFLQHFAAGACDDAVAEMETNLQLLLDAQLARAEP